MAMFSFCLLNTSFMAFHPVNIENYKEHSALNSHDNGFREVQIAGRGSTGNSNFFFAFRRSSIAFV